jgi:hypothetical protein
MNRFRKMFDVVGRASAVFTFAGILTEAAMPDIIHENAFTQWLAKAAYLGVFPIWLCLAYRIIGGLDEIYGPRCCEE